MQLFKLVGSIFVDNQKANESIAKTDEKAEDLGKKFVSGVGKAAKWAAGITTAAVGMATAVGSAMVKIADDTREYRTEMGKLDTAFQTSGFTVDVAKNTYKELQSVLGETDQSVEAANHLAKLCQTQEELASWTDICTGVYATFGASLPIEGLTEAANETAKVGQVTGSLADALNWAGVSEDAFNESLAKCSNEQERQKLITETLNGLYSESAEKYRENNKEVIEANKAQEELNEKMAAIGGIIEPLITDIKLIGAEFLEDILPPATDFVNLIIGKLPEVINWFKEHKGIIIGVSTAIGVLTTAVGLYNAVQAIKTAMNAAEATSLTGLIAMKIADAAATMVAMAPYLLIAAAIAAVIAIGVLLWKNWDKIKEKAAELKENLSERFTEIREGAKEKFEAVKNAITGAIEDAKESTRKKLSAMRAAFDEHGGGIQGVVAAMMKGIQMHFQERFDFIDNLTGGKLSAIRDKFKNRLGEARDTVKAILDKIKDLFNFNWSLPKIKMPHFSIKPRGWEFGDLLKGSIPKLGIEWYAKAMDKGIIMNSPTIFGVNGDGNLMGGGEAGSETVVGTNSLMDMIQNAVADQNGNLIYYMQKLIEILADYFPQILESMDKDLIFNDGVVAARLAPAMNKELGKIKDKEDRGR